MQINNYMILVKEFEGTTLKASHYFYGKEFGPANIQFWDLVIEFGKKVGRTGSTTLCLQDTQGGTIQNIEVRG